MNDLGGPAPIVAVGLSALTSRCALVNGLQSLPHSAQATRHLKFVCAIYKDTKTAEAHHRCASAYLWNF